MPIIKRSFFSLLLAGIFLASAQAQARIDVIVNAENSVSLDQERVKNIFLGKIRQFAEGLTAKPVDLPEGDAVRNLFYKKFFEKSDMDMKLYWSTTIFTGAGTPPRALNSEKEILQYVRENKGGIGYVSGTVRDPGVRVIFSVN